jgi:hypothetical protein
MVLANAARASTGSISPLFRAEETAANSACLVSAGSDASAVSNACSGARTASSARSRSAASSAAFASRPAWAASSDVLCARCAHDGQHWSC